MSSKTARSAWLLFALTLAGASSHAATVGYEVTSLSPSLSFAGERLFRYTYFVDFSLMENQELEVRFPADLFLDLHNEVATPDFDVVVFQPNDPLGLYGSYSALAKKDFPLMTTFSVDFQYVGSGIPGPQRFFINQFDQNQRFVGVVLDGSTVLATPEPGGFMLCGLLLIVVAARRSVRHRSA